MLAYMTNIWDNTTLLLSTDSDLFKFLKGMTPIDAPVPAQPADAIGR
jgi:hypothetical protein